MSTNPLTEPQFINKQKKSSEFKEKIQFIDFQQPQRPHRKKSQQKPKRTHRQSQNIKKISQAYGGNAPPQKSKQIYVKNKLSKRNNATQADKKNYTTFHQQSSTDGISQTRSFYESELLNKLNKQEQTVSNSNQLEIETIPIEQKFHSIQPLQPTEIKVQKKRNISLPEQNNNSQQLLISKPPLIDQKIRSPKMAKTQAVTQNILNKQKIKQIYDKIRQPQTKVSPRLIQGQYKNKQSTQLLNQNGDLKQSQKKNQKPTQKRLKGKQQDKPLVVIQKSTLSNNLDNKVSIIWIFVIKSNLPNQLRQRINQMYNPLSDDEKAVPLLDDPKRISQFVKIPNCYFKIVTDIQSAQKSIGFRIYNTVVEFYIWNRKGDETLLKALQYKNITRKVKGIFTDWDRILSRAEDEIEEQIAIFKVNNGLEKRQRQRKFPNFLKLTDTDKTDATLYRINLYGAIKMLPQQKKVNYQNFMNLVKAKYGSKQQEKENISDYAKIIDHTKMITSCDQAKKVIEFYVRESFYYQVVNSMLRTVKTSEEFKPCILPFNETYHAIKLYYEQYLRELNDQIPQLTLYRGCKMNKKDFSQLKEKVFIEMFGFLSTSKSEQRAKDFVDRDGYIFVIHIKNRKANQKRFSNYDHGFVDINRYHLASKQFSHEEEVLINALNVFQIIKIQKKNNYKYIHLEYGVIFDLLQKPRENLTPDEYDTLVNYHYCTKILGKIQDQGDVFLFANQLTEAKQYYNEKIKQGQNLSHNYYKLASVQKQCGQIDEAQKNANEALKLLSDQIDLSDREKCLKVFGIHSKNAQINLQREDYLTADDQIDKAMSMLSDDDMFERAVMLRQRGQIKFKKGQVKKAQDDFEESQSIFENLKDQGKLKKISAYRKYYLSHLCLPCIDKTRTQIKNQLNEQLAKIRSLQQKISQMNENIQDQLIKINKSLKDVALYVQDREKYEIEVKKAQSYLYSLKARKANDPDIKAKMLTMQALVNDYISLAQSEKLMDEAIRLIEEKNPFDMKVADYSKILAKMQKAELQKFTNPPKILLNQKPSLPIPYDAHARRQIYEKCKKNFQKTIKVLLYHAKNNSSPQIMDIRNQLGQLAFGQNDYEECEKIIQQARKDSGKVVHTQMAKTLLVIAKISFARGELKNAFQTLKQAQKVLQQAMVNKHSKQKLQKNRQQYMNIFKNSDTFLTIQMIRVTIYQKQKNHDLALKSVDQIHSIIVKKVGQKDSHPMLAELLQLQGVSKVFKGKIYEFDQNFQKAIELREKQFGFYHPVNAKACCTYAKFLIMVNDISKAEKILSKGVQIISAFEQTNPHYWAIYFSQGFFNQQQKLFDRSEAFYEKSLEWSQKYFNKSHIAIKEIMLKFANLLRNSKKYHESMRMYESLERQLEEGLRLSRSRKQVQNEKDDEKISLTKLMYSQLSDLQAQSSRNSDNYGQTTQDNLIDTSLYKSKLNLLRRTYKIEDSVIINKKPSTKIFAQVRSHEQQKILQNNYTG